MIKATTLTALFASAALVAACGGGGEGPDAPPPSPTWINWANSTNGEIVKDGNNENFKVRASDRVVVSMLSMSQFNGTLVDSSANLFVNGVLVGSVTTATSTAGTQIAVFRCNNGRMLDFYNDTPTTYSWVC